MQQVKKYADEVWEPSRFVRELYIESGMEPSRVHIVPNGVDVSQFRPGLKPFPIRSSKSFRFLFVGGTIHRKGIDVLLNGYLQAFRPSDDVALIVKDFGTAGIYRGQGYGKQITELRQDPEAPEIIYVEKDTQR